jgi:hypothetical protein
MKLAPSVLLEIMSIIQEAMIGEKDASEALRELDLQETVSSEGVKVLTLTSDYAWTHRKDAPPLPDGPSAG